MSTMGAVNGLLINNDYMDCISNNIANASTIGYKSSKPVFFDIFSHSFFSKSNYGYGVGISNIVQNFNNGMLVETGRDLDLGIIQNGFFRVLDSKGNVHYTRDGQFLLDKNKNIINMQGMYLTGHNKSYSRNGLNNVSSLEPINLQQADIMKEKPTSEIALKAILNSNTSLSTTGGENNNLSDLESCKTYVYVYTKDGQKERINISFSRTDKNTWQINIESNDAVHDTSNKSIDKSIDTSFDLKFNSDGELISLSKLYIVPKNSKYENIMLNLTGTTEQANINNSLEERFQNGYSKGLLNTFNISPNGEIIGTYSNKQTQAIGQILLSKFVNPEKLKPESGNTWSATEESGIENVGIADDSGFGFITEKSLEASNVDLNKELINMIIAQRNYQSNAQSFKTEDKIISTLINLR